VTAAKEHVARSSKIAADGDAAWRAAAALLCRQIEESMSMSVSVGHALEPQTQPLLA
jgi:hypothetical protein